MLEIRSKIINNNASINFKFPKELEEEEEYNYCSNEVNTENFADEDEVSIDHIDIGSAMQVIQQVSQRSFMQLTKLILPK